MNPTLLHIVSLLTAASVAGLWQGVLIAAVAAALCGLLRNASAAIRHTVLVVAFGSLLVLPWISSQLSSQLSSHQSGTAATGTANHLAPLHLAPWIATAIAALWLVMSLFRAAELLVAARHLRTVRQSAKPLPGAEPIQVGRRTVLLCSSVQVDAPVILGFRSPRLLLPEAMLPGLSSSELHHIALHESEHLRRGDDWTNLLVELALVLSPINPALLWLRRTIRLQRELAVDAAVVRQTQEPLAYAGCLTHLSEQRMHGSQLRLALSALGRKPDLVHRVHALLHRTTGWTRTRSTAAFAGSLATLLAVAAATGCIPQLVEIGTTPSLTAPTTHSAPDATAVLAPATSAAFVPASDPGALPLVKAVAHTSAATDGAPARLVTATFTTGVTPSTGSTNHRKSKRGTNTRNASTRNLAPALAAPPHMLRTAYTAPATPPVRFQNTASDGSTFTSTTARGSSTAQAAPAVIYTRYAAVPLQDGWLIIEL